MHAGGLKDGVYDHLLDDALAALAEEAGRSREVDVADLDPARTPSFAAAHLRPLVERVLASVKGEDAPDNAESALLVNTPDEPSLGRELTRELASAERGPPLRPS